MKEILLIDLIAKTRDAIKPLKHSKSTQWQYDYAWRELSNYFTRIGVSQFSSSLANQYVLDAHQRYKIAELAEWKFKLIRKSISLLMQYYEYGSVKWQFLPSWNKPSLNSEKYTCILHSYINQLKREEYGQGTIEIRKSIAKKFFNYLEQEEIHDLLSLTLDAVSNFVPYVSKFYQSSSMGTVFSALRSFLTFASLSKLTPTNLARAIPSGFGRKTSIIPVITLSEEDKLLAVINHETATDKRGYAILLLSLRLGLRAVDIVNLKFGNISWRTNTIEIIQQKTGRALTIPLLADIGNAIVDYLLHGRPQSLESYIFLRIQAPYTKLSGHSSIYHVVSMYMKKAGIRQSEGEQRGSHCLRHTVAARLLATEAPLPIISSILGHADKNSARVYLSTDLEHLRACALGLDGIEVAKKELQ